MAMVANAASIARRSAVCGVIAVCSTGLTLMPVICLPGVAPKATTHSVS